MAANPPIADMSFRCRACERDQAEDAAESGERSNPRETQAKERAGGEVPNL